MPMPTRRDFGKIDRIELNHVEWRIPDIFVDSVHPDGCLYVSPTFFTTGAYWDLRLWINWKQKDGFIKISIATQDEATRGWSLKYFFGLKNCNHCSEELVDGILEGVQYWSSWKDLIKQSELLRRKAVLAPTDILTVTCTLKWKTEITHPPELSGLDEKKCLKLTRLDKLSANFKDFYADKETCDVILKVQDAEFKAHRLVLMARSSVFSAALNQDTLENQTWVITIPDCDPESFQAFLDYLYSGELVDLSLGSALNLYYTSNKYDIEEVKKFCIDYLMQCLAIENVCEVAEFADKCNEVQLFSQVQDFFNKDSSEILLTSGWEYLIRKDWCLANKLLTGMAKNQRASSDMLRVDHEM